MDKKRKDDDSVILVIEDNAANMRLVCDLLRAHGYRTVGAATGLNIKEIIDCHQPSLILMDISLKGIDGLALTRCLKNDPKTKHIPIVIITAHAMKRTETEARDNGCDGFILKPICTRTLIGQLKVFLPNT